VCVRERESHCVCVFVCVRERQREGERERWREREREREREWEKERESEREKEGSSSQRPSGPATPKQGVIECVRARESERGHTNPQPTTQNPNLKPLDPKPHTSHR